MNSIIIFGLGVVVGVVIVKVLDSRPSVLRTSGSKDFRGNDTEGRDENFIGKQTREKEKNKRTILDLMAESNKPITNEYVQQMLGFSESSVTRYFDELEKDGKVRQVGKTGQSVYYSKTEKP